MYRYILFDLDGTLTDPKEGITKCVQYALKSLGIEAECDDLLDFIGPPLIESFQKYFGLSAEDAQFALTKYRERFAKVGLLENKVYPRIPEILAKLGQTGRKVALATSKAEIYAREILDNFHLTPYFDVIVGSELDGRRIDKADVIEEVLRQFGLTKNGDNMFCSEILMVGDRLHDINGATKNGVDSLGVYYGYAHQGELEAAKATHIVYTVEELEQFLNRDLEG